MDNYWTKIDYILELASWLFSNEYLLDHVSDLIDWAIDLLLTSSDAYKQQQQEINNIDGQELNTEIDNDTDQIQMGSIKPKCNYIFK